MKSWKRKAAMFVAGSAALGSVGIAAPAQAEVVQTSGTVAYVDPTLIQIDDANGLASFYYLDSGTVFNDGLTFEALTGQDVFLRVDNETFVVSVIDSDGVFGDEPAPEPAPEPEPDPEPDPEPEPEPVVDTPGNGNGNATGITNGTANPPAHGQDKDKGHQNDKDKSNDKSNDKSEDKKVKKAKKVKKVKS